MRSLCTLALTNVPVTLALIALLWLLRLVGGVSDDPTSALFGLIPGEAVHTFRWVSAGFTSSSGHAAVMATIAAILLAMPAERVLGSVRFGGAVLLMNAVSLTGGLLSGRVVQAFGLNQWGSDLQQETVLTPIGWIFGTAAIAASAMPLVWRRRVRATLWATSATLIAFAGTPSNFVAFAAVLVGSMIGALQLGGSRYQPVRIRMAKPSLRESRLLVAVILFCVAIGPVLVAFNPLAHGPFSLPGSVIWEPTGLMEVSEIVCGFDPEGRPCTEVTALLTQIKLGTTVALLMALVFQGVLCWWLAKGRQVAWVLSLINQMLTLGLLIGQLYILDDSLGGPILYLINGFFLTLPWLASLVLLIATRRWFFVETAKGAIRRALTAVLVAYALLGLCCGIWIAAASPRVNTFDAIVSAYAQLLCSYYPAVSYTFGPVFDFTFQARLVMQWTGTLFWLIITVVVWRMLSSLPRREGPERRAKMRALLESGTGDHLSWMGLWQGNRYWFDDPANPRAGVAYRVQRNVAVTLGEPVRTDDAAALDHIAKEFERFAHANGWQVAWYSVRKEFAELLEPSGYRRVHVAEEAVMSTEHIEFKGKKFQNIRTARNRAQKEGVRAVWTSWEELHQDTQQKITALSEEWVGDKALPEMGFTLGTLEELREPRTKLLIAIDEDAKVHGVTSWLPVFESGTLVGYTLDFMRRDASGFRPVIEFLLAEALVQSAALGCQWISLSGAPLAPSAEPDEHQSFIDLALNAAGGAIEPLYGFRSLASSKYKFHPSHQGWYLCYSDPLALPSIGVAISQCYLPQLKPTDARNAVRAWAAAREEEKQQACSSPQQGRS